jgi:FlaA1/EpsC-like NDP-sugar epimerase
MRFSLSSPIRRRIAITYDLAAIGVAFVGAFLIRFDFQVPPETSAILWKGLPFVYLIQSSVFFSQGLYRGLWSFASLKDLSLILRAVTLSIVASMAILVLSWNHLQGWPRSVFLIDGLLLVLILGGGRFGYRYGREVAWGVLGKRKRILIVGAGQSASLISREFSSRAELSAQIVGFLDDNRQITGFNINGSPVLGPLDSIDRWLSKLAPDEVIIAIPRLSGLRVKQILSTTRAHHIPCRICPPVRDVLLGRVELNQLREVHVEDLLRREVIKVDDEGMAQQFSNKVVLITGGGGSIGSELCRQVLAYHPRKVVLFDRSEFNLYRLHQEQQRVRGLSSDTTLHFIVGDILNGTRLNQVFADFKPEIVLHAAAYKHVPLMEENVYEALLNNLCGTYRLVKMSAQYSVENFTFISTDKAVRPTSIMGATKRMAELVINALVKRDQLRTTTVRFGNVLNSEGSVLPLFREQIARRGPVTVTHRDVTRFFMTIPEASQLVLQASLLGKGGEVFLLDMGEPVLVRELAEELIKLSGLRPYEDVDIVFTGLRPGEKLYEELLVDMDNAHDTLHSKIKVSTHEHTARNLPSDWEKTLQDFMAADSIPPADQLERWISEWVPEFRRENGPVPVELSEPDQAVQAFTLPAFSELAAPNTGA